MSAYTSPWMNDELAFFRRSVRQFLQEEFVPHDERWRAQHHVDRDAWRKAGRAGLLLAAVPEDFGGGGASLAHTAVVIEEVGRAGISSFGGAVQEIVGHYVLAYGSDAQKRAWLPGLASGHLVGAIAMTEPGAGSDLQAITTTARRDGDTYVISGTKTFITNGYHADLVCVAARTGEARAGAAPPPGRARTISLVMVET